ncbi:uncharacterized protein TRIADDRAFT_34519 [Trichoplax adhaerens]|uniref:Tyrosine-protein phosphatase domain-containing protein n=2 Tax=Trichoplax adhaerens TaxID=10228 RepID=B3SEH5_TRIAD|nr:hypothetical protein TRIADDRAFT_34519 [Trichoplax adhaerens]EDV18870.1 hypothetical protein TRIADDRAFT_34519 [Trichoplax adhaerens]|eukprot:XP_002118643.1 hypothetical protein TRIADDRAFT_34519 [Trichoplax adhaerens]
MFNANFYIAEYEKPIPIDQFIRHVSNLHENTDLGFYNEFEVRRQLAMSKNITWTHSLNLLNKAKNRYDNVIAYDHTRVKLNPIPDDLGSTYINANFIKTNGKVKTIIATQGPLSNTVGDFWRMIWEQRVNVIVMITNIVEKGRRKCERYWPENGKNQTFGAISVTLTKETTYPEYTIRHMNVKKVERTAKMFNAVKQFHYTCWPDHGVPNNTNGIMKFIKKSVAANVLASAPIVVHCSAGVGRTGTYIVLETMMKHIDDGCDINIYKFISDIRSQRNMMVQTEVLLRI